MTGASFGRLSTGQEVRRYAVGGPVGVVLHVLDLGATVQSLTVPDDRGRPVEVVLGFADATSYESAASDCFGGIVGRYANRIAGGDLVIDGVHHQLATNEGDTTLHGGPEGFNQRIWEVEEHDASHLRLALTSPDGDQGFPGRLRVTVTYTVGEHDVRIDYTAECDAATVVNLTSHTYVNLQGAGTGGIEDHELLVDADRYTVTGAGQIPTGEVATVVGTPFDFRSATRIGDRLRASEPQMVTAHGYDQNLVLRGEGMRRAAWVRDPRSGRTLDVHTDQPGVQVYTSNMLDGTLAGASGTTYRQGDALALETQHFPDAPHHPEFPSTVLRPGERFTSSTWWRFGRD